MKWVATILVAVGISICVAAEAHAGPLVVNVDIDSSSYPSFSSLDPVYAGPGAFSGDSGTYWNGYPLLGTLFPGPSTINNLVASDGITTTSVSFSLGSCYTGTPYNTNSIYQWLLGDYAYVQSGNSVPVSTFSFWGWNLVKRMPFICMAILTMGKERYSRSTVSANRPLAATPQS